MYRRALTQSRFDESEEEPLGGLQNLVDIVLVFAAGLIAALAAHYDALPAQSQQQAQQQREVVKGQELPEMPAQAGQSGSGYESVGQVYRDPETGKLFLVGD